MRSAYISRRRLLGTTGSALLAMNLWPGALAHADAAAEDFEFIAANDTHFRDANCPGFFTRVAAKIGEASPKAELCLVLGDLADRNRVAQLAGMRDVLKTWKIQTRVVRGNHDWTAADDSDTSEGRSFEEIFPKSVNYSFDYRGWQFVGLDSTERSRPSEASMQPDAFRWLDENLKKIDRKRPMVVFTHFPVGENVPLRYRLKNGEEMLARFKEFNLRAVLSGHWHGHTESRKDDLLLSTAQCCSRAAVNDLGKLEKGFLVCSVKNGRVERRFVEVAA